MGTMNGFYAFGCNINKSTGLLDVPKALVTMSLLQATRMSCKLAHLIIIIETKCMMKSISCIEAGEDIHTMSNLIPISWTLHHTSLIENIECGQLKKAWPRSISVSKPVILLVRYTLTHWQLRMSNNCQRPNLI